MLIETQLERPEALVRMRAARKSKGFTLTQVAEKIGKSPVWVGAAFSGQATLTPETAGALAAVLDIAILQR